MKFKKMIFNYTLYYILGNIIFNLVFSIAKNMYINYLGAHELIISTLLSSFRETIIFYSILFFIIALINIIYMKNTINKLNNKLNKIKKGSEENEK